MSSQFSSDKTLKMIEKLFSFHSTDAVYIVACRLLSKDHPLKKHVLEACAILRLINDQDADALADQLFEWYHFWYTSQITIEHASVRQNARRGYILVEKTPAETYEKVLSWHIFPNGQTAMDAKKILDQHMDELKDLGYFERHNKEKELLEQKTW